MKTGGSPGDGGGGASMSLKAPFVVELCWSVSIATSARTAPASRNAATAVTLKLGSGCVDGRHGPAALSRSSTRSGPATTAPPSGSPATRIG